MICGVQYAALLMFLHYFVAIIILRSMETIILLVEYLLLDIFTENVEVLEFQLKTSFLRQLREWSNL